MGILIASEITKKKNFNPHCILINSRLICKHHKANWKSSLKVVENIMSFFPQTLFQLLVEPENNMSVCCIHG